MKPLNRDQLDGLAKLCFDLAKGALIFAFLPPGSPDSFIIQLVKILTAFIIGLAFTFGALLLLRWKERVS